MKLAVLGAVTAGIGIALAIPGLTWIGAYWVLLGLPARIHGRRILDAREGDDGATPQVGGRAFATGTALLLAVGVPALVVGVLELGFPVDDVAWRWLPIVVGGVATGIAVVSSVLYLTGRAIDAGTAAATTPATIWIRSMSETGTFINERPRLEFELLVEPDPATGIAPYEVTKKATTPFTALGSLQVGAGFRALVVGPTDPAAMTIQWDQPVPGPAGETPTSDTM